MKQLYFYFLYVCFQQKRRGSWSLYINMPLIYIQLNKWDISTMHIFLIHYSENTSEADLPNKLQYGSNYFREIRSIAVFRGDGPNKEGLVVMWCQYQPTYRLQSGCELYARRITRADIRPKVHSGRKPTRFFETLYLSTHWDLHPNIEQSGDCICQFGNQKKNPDELLLGQQIES